jgi:hypothetical protein
LLFEDSSNGLVAASLAGKSVLAMSSSLTLQRQLEAHRCAEIEAQHILADVEEVSDSYSRPDLAQRLLRDDNFLGALLAIDDLTEVTGM